MIIFTIAVAVLALFADVDFKNQTKRHGKR
jgi:hypothetical protein